VGDRLSDGERFAVPRFALGVLGIERLSVDNFDPLAHGGGIGQPVHGRPNASLAMAPILWFDWC
jgi:hypothetical protein